MTVIKFNLDEVAAPGFEFGTLSEITYSVEDDAKVIEIVQALHMLGFSPSVAFA